MMNDCLRVRELLFERGMLCYSHAVCNAIVSRYSFDACRRRASMAFAKPGSVSTTAAVGKSSLATLTGCRELM